MNDTLDYKISVMQAAKEGKEIESMSRQYNKGWGVTPFPGWNWYEFDYRVKAQEPRRIWVSKWEGQFGLHESFVLGSTEFIELTESVRDKLGL